MRRLILPATGLLAVTCFAFAVLSPLQQGREAVWVIGGLAGVAALVLLPFQPLLVAGVVRPLRGRRAHRWLGITVLALVLAHVGGLWLYSPEDINDALLLRAPTPFSAWGVIGMSVLLIAGLLALSRRSLGAQSGWRALHFALAALGAVCAVIHAWLILGAMEPISKTLLCALILASLVAAIGALRRIIRIAD